MTPHTHTKAHTQRHTHTHTQKAHGIGLVSLNWTHTLRLCALCSALNHISIKCACPPPSCSCSAPPCYYTHTPQQTYNHDSKVPTNTSQEALTCPEPPETVRNCTMAELCGPILTRSPHDVFEKCEGIWGFISTTLRHFVVSFDEPSAQQHPRTRLGGT